MAMYTTFTEEEQKEQKPVQQPAKAPEVNSQAQQLSSAATEAPAVQQPVQQKASTVYNPANDAAYQQAMNTLQQVKDSRPNYQNSYDTQLKQLYDEITGRESFNYDMTADTLYQQYKQQYQNQGQLAMRDTMGQAAALTGGYGSSYGQAVGQQQYNAYLQQLNDVVPELYGMAYQQYQDQGDALKDRYAMMGQMANDEYGKYQDAMSQYWQNLSYQQGIADDLYNRGMQQAELNYAREQDAYDRNWKESQEAYNRQQDAYSKLSDLVLNFGYVPNAGDLEEAGMSQAEYDSLRAYYKKLNPDPVASSGGDSGYIGGGSAWDAIKADLDNGASLVEINGKIANSGLENRTELVSKASEYAAATGKGQITDRQMYDKNYGYW